MWQEVARASVQSVSPHVIPPALACSSRGKGGYEERELCARRCSVSAGTSSRQSLRAQARGGRRRQSAKGLISRGGEGARWARREGVRGRHSLLTCCGRGHYCCCSLRCATEQNAPAPTTTSESHPLTDALPLRQSCFSPSPPPLAPWCSAFYFALPLPCARAVCRAAVPALTLPLACSLPLCITPPFPLDCARYGLVCCREG